MNKSQFASALSVALLVFVWVWVGLMFGLPVWVGFVAWATFFAAGAQYSTVKVILPPFIVGLLLGYLSGLAIGAFTPALGGVSGPLFSAITAFIIMALMGIRQLSFAPAMFLGWASFVGNGFKLVNTLEGLLIGILLGVLSITLPNLVVKEENSSKTSV